MDADLNYFEKVVAQKVKQVKPKSKQRGYAKKLVARMFSVIEESLKQGCDYDDIATAISETNVKITPSTLKRYHLANRKLKRVDEKTESFQTSQNQVTATVREQVNESERHSRISNEQEPSNLVDRLRLSNSSLDDDFFNKDDDNESDFVKPYVRRGN
jgi:hypothetical protein